jgi:hypothetical protein
MKTSVILLILLMSVIPTLCQERTKVNDQAAAKMLLGRHKLSLQWISWDYFGAATVKQARGIYSLKGEQRGRGNKDYLTIEGMIVSIDKNQFVLEGDIVTRVSHINGGKPCTRHGDFTFKITGKRKYWRMQEMDNPCDEATDYVDIYFR